MYQGYRLKINNVTVPNSIIQKGSFSVNDDERVVEVWTDANFVEHKITAGKKAVISFYFTEHDSDHHGLYVTHLRLKDNIPVEYYDDSTDEYRTCTCRLNPITWKHRSSYGGMLQYAATAITLVEN